MIPEFSSRLSNAMTLRRALTSCQNDGLQNAPSIGLAAIAGLPKIFKISGVRT